MNTSKNKNQIKKHIFLIILIIFNFQFSIFNCTAQPLTGRVTEFSENGVEMPVPGAILQWLNSPIGTVSDIEGKFTLEKVKTTDIIIVKYASYDNDTITVKKEQTELNIILASSHTLNTVNVVAREGSFISIKPIFTQVITGEGLRRAACCNLGESFESSIAVDVEYSDAVSGAKQISMLGLAGIYTQILLENIPYIRLLSNQFGLGYVPGSWMDMISISKGTASVTNGYEGITGQIQLDFKKPETNRERLFVNIFGNSMGKGELNLNSRFDMNKKKTVSGMFLMHGEGQFAKIDHNHDHFMDVPQNYQFNGMYRIDYKAPEVFEGRAMIGYLFEDRIGGMMHFDPKKNINELVNNNIWGLRIKTNKLDAITKNGFLINGGEFQSIGTILSFNYQKDKSQFGSRLYDATQLSGYFNVIYSNKFGAKKNHKINAGASFQMDNVDEQLRENTDWSLMPLPASYYSGKRTEAVPGVFAEYAYSIEAKFIIMPGMRLDYNFNCKQLFWTPRLHLKWQLTPETSIRVSAGKGYRTSNPIIENLSLLVSNRQFVFKDQFVPEQAWNTGISLVQSFNMPGGKSSFSVDYYYTHFLNQTIIDLDNNPHEVLIYNLNGDYNGKGNLSYSHSAQAELILMPFKRFEVTLAYRFNDVRLTTAGKLQQKSLMSPHKALLNLNYSLLHDKWKFNVTFQYNSPMRLPDMSDNPEEYRPVVNKNGKSPAWVMMNAQVTKKFRLWEIYIGGENLLNYKQQAPIISSDKPFGEFFDASVIYMPVTGIMGYVGIRVTLK
ncbi:MAG: TonB-dependent receptor [Bacteroidetes bacterium]|nr:TonB-dependent receptor [Bacteroidota bacterium]MCL1968515.1 TonB-dependent receptor [Bacteroidota bacterium]